MQPHSKTDDSVLTCTCRCGTYYLLLVVAAKHRLAHGRYRTKDDEESICEEHNADY